MEALPASRLHGTTSLRNTRALALYPYILLTSFMTISSGISALIERYISRRASDLYDFIARNGRLAVSHSTPSDDVASATELETYGFVFRHAVPTGYELLPTPTEIVIPSLVHRVDWRYPPFAVLSDDGRAKLREQLLQLNTVHHHDSSNYLEPHVVHTFEGSADIDGFLARIIPETSDLRAISAATWSANLPLVWTVILKRMEEGMRYRRIVSPLGLVAFGLEINRRDTRDIGIELRVTLTPTESPFYIFSGESISSVLVFVPPATATAKPRATYTPLVTLTERLSAAFEDQWSAAVPATVILQRLSEYRSEYINSVLRAAGAESVTLAGDLFDRGIFADAGENNQHARELLIRHGFAVPTTFTIGATNYVPNIVSTVERYIREESSRDTRAN